MATAIKVKSDCTKNFLKQDKEFHMTVRWKPPHLGESAYLAVPAHLISAPQIAKNFFLQNLQTHWQASEK